MSGELLTQLSRAEVQSKLQRLEPTESQSEVIANQLAETVFDQPEACRAVGRRLNMFESGLADPDRPLGVLYFVGPTGSGKTEMAHAVADFMFDDPKSDRLKILNMSEYSESHYATRLTGSPPSYVGSEEEAAIPHDWLHAGRSVIVFDEIEKAHPKVHQTLLSIFDRGILNARNGRQGQQELNFTNSLLILTSNVAGREVADILRGHSHRLGFGVDKPDDRQAEAKRAVDKGLRDQFPPEFLGRIDDVVVFNPIESRATKDAIISKFLTARNNHLQELFESNAPYIALTQEARDFLVAHAGDEGGRALKKALELYIFDRMADVMSNVDFFRRPFVADIQDGNTEWYTDEPTPPEPAPTNVIPFPETVVTDVTPHKTKTKEIKQAPPEEPTPSEDTPPDADPDDSLITGKTFRDLLGDDVAAFIPGTPNGQRIDIFVSVHSPDDTEVSEAAVYNVPMGTTKK